MAGVVIERRSEKDACIANGAYDAGGSSLESWPTMVAQLTVPKLLTSFATGT
ncbi:hypothetical protein Rcae01_01133 [Novipirellula caenicola]|uniref:Uncharacterized protein n=1 Tax=Novipirellula caenicola TaxID=1536901 RepID=A0ABP9VPN9_9BACT